MIMSHPIAPHIEPYFTQYLTGTGGTRKLSANTILSYRDSLKFFFCFAGDNHGKDVDQLLVEDLDDKTVLAFLEHLESDSGNCIKTRNLRLAGIRSFFAFLARELPELIGIANRVRSISNKQTPHHNADFLDDAEIGAVLESVKPEDRMSSRNKALLLFLHNTGARVQEVVDLHIDDLRLDEMAQVKLMGKGQKQRACSLWPNTVEDINNYLQDRCPRDADTDALFLNYRGEPMTRAGVYYIVKKYAAVAAQKCPTILTKSVSPHTFRHSIAMMLVRAGNDIQMIQRFLGHANINTTHSYFDLDMDMKRKVLETVRPPSSRRKPRWKKPKVLEFLNQLTKGGLTRTARPL